MPNGFHGGPDEWRRLEGPLLTLDAKIEQFARTHGLSLSKNYHGWPERSLVLTDGYIRRLIQIYLESEKTLTLNIWLCVSEDRGSERFWKRKFLRRDAPAGEISTNIENLLQQALAMVCGWKDSDLELATLTGKKTP
jgi:hypothetical protein